MLQDPARSTKTAPAALDAQTFRLPGPGKVCHLPPPSPARQRDIITARADPHRVDRGGFDGSPLQDRPPAESSAVPE